MTLRDKLNKEIPNNLFFGILAGVILGVAVFVIYWLFVANSGATQCGLPPMDIRIMKLDTQGNEDWNRSIDSGADDQAYTILPTPDGGYAISGLYDNNVDTMVPDIIKLNRSGSTEWEKRYPEYEGQFNGFFLNPDGGFFAGRYPGKILVLDAQGNVTREIRYGDDNTPSFFSPRQNQGFIVLLENMSVRNSTVLSLDPDGRVIWRHDNLPIVALSEYSLQVTSDGGCIVAGYTPGVRELFYVRLDSWGNETWNATRGKSWDNRPVLMAEPRPGLFEIMYESARNSDTPPAIIMGTFFVTFNDNGGILRQRTLNVSPPVSHISGPDYFATHLPEKDYASSYGFGMPHSIVRLNDEESFDWQAPVSPEWYMVRSIVPTDNKGCVVLGSSIQKKKFFSCF